MSANHSIVMRTKMAGLMCITIKWECVCQGRIKMKDIQSDIFWKSVWVEALVMLPLGLLVAVYSAHFANGWGLISIIIGLAILRLIYDQVMLKSEGKLGSVPKGKLAIWLFSIQLILVAFLGGLIVFLS